jgi:predicted DNA-binding transcriptional regulator AlpA
MTLDNEPLQLITIKEAMKIMGVRNSATLYRHIHAGLLPKPVKTGPNSRRFVKQECLDYVRKLMAERDDGTA